jgi:predicted NAD/FAD-binding protein
MSRPTLAIVGTGVAGMGCAHFLQQRHELTLFEQNDSIGGHTNTIEVAEGTGKVAFDTGFMVYNKVTYPRLVRLFEELKVPVKPTDMSFSVQHVPSSLEYAGSSLNHLFAQRRNLFRPRHYRMLLQVNRFNREAVEALTDSRWEGVTIGEYVRVRGYGQDFLDLFLVPMSSAVWSTPPDGMLGFPAVTLLRFFHNHGFLGLHTQHPWWTVDGGSREYVRRLMAPLLDRVRLSDPVVGVQRMPGGGAEVTTRSGWCGRFDRVILAAHADQSLRLLRDADVEERRLLGEFHYQRNLAVVHTDPCEMPRARLAWSAWNYRIKLDAEGRVRPATVYWMNRLQGVSDRMDYFVSINGGEGVSPDRVIRKIEYEHPLFSLGAIRAQALLPGLNRRSPGQAVFFCGSYFRYGFHEDAFSSAVDLCEGLTGKKRYPAAA